MVDYSAEELKVKEHLNKLLAKADLKVYSRRNARRELEGHFGIDMKTAKWKKFIKDCVTTFVQDTCRRIKLPVPARYQPPGKKIGDDGPKEAQKADKKVVKLNFEEEKQGESTSPDEASANLSCDARLLTVSQLVASAEAIQPVVKAGVEPSVVSEPKPPTPSPPREAEEHQPGDEPPTESPKDSDAKQSPREEHTAPKPVSESTPSPRTRSPASEKSKSSAPTTIPPDFVSEEPEEEIKSTKSPRGSQDIFDSLAEQMIADEQSKENSEKEDSSRTGKLYITEAESKSRSNSEKARRRSRNRRRSRSPRKRRQSRSRDRRGSRNRSRRQEHAAQGHERRRPRRNLPSRGGRYPESRRSRNSDRYKKRDRREDRRSDRARESSKRRGSNGRRSSYTDDHKKLLVDLLRYVEEDEQRRRTYNLSNKRVSNFRDRYPSFRSKAEIEDAVSKVKAFKSYFRDGLLCLESKKESRSIVQEYFRGRSNPNRSKSGSRRNSRASTRGSRERTKSPKREDMFDRAPKPPSPAHETKKRRQREDEGQSAKPRKKRAVDTMPTADLELDMNALEAVSLDELANDGGSKRKADPGRIESRQKQINLTKAKQVYIDYCEQVPKTKRTTEDPMTPNPAEDISNKRFKGKLKVWRSSLHSRMGREDM